MIYDFYKLRRDDTIRYDKIMNVMPIYHDVPSLRAPYYRNDVSFDTLYVGGEMDFKIKKGNTDLPVFSPAFSIFKSYEIWANPKKEKKDYHGFNRHIFIERIYILFENKYYPYAIRIRENSNTCRILNITYISHIYKNTAYPWDQQSVGSVFLYASENISRAYALGSTPIDAFHNISDFAEITKQYPYVYEYNTIRDVNLAVSRDMLSLKDKKGIFPTMNDYISICHMHTPLTAKDINGLYRQDCPVVPGKSPPIEIPKAQHILTIEDPCVRKCVAPLRDIVADELYVSTIFNNCQLVDERAYMYFDRYVNLIGESYFQDDMDNVAESAKTIIENLCLWSYGTDVFDRLHEFLDVHIQKTSNEEAVIVIRPHTDKGEALVCIYIDFTLSALTCYSLCVDNIRQYV